MALQKQPVNISFGQGLDTKTDPYQVQLGKFLDLRNSVFTAGNRLTKRNGYGIITELPNTDQTNLTTLNDNLIATGSNLYAYNKELNIWTNQGNIQPVQLSTLPVARQGNDLTDPDITITSTGLGCLLYTKDNNVYYIILDTDTGQQIVTETLLDSNVTKYVVAQFSNYFILSWISGSNLKYIAINISTLVANAPVTISTTVSTAGNATFSTVQGNNNLYYVWSNSGANIGLIYLTHALSLSPPSFIAAGGNAGLIAVKTDISTSGASTTFWSCYEVSTTNTGYYFIFDVDLNILLTPTVFSTGLDLAHNSLYVNNSAATLVSEVTNDYASPYPIPNVQTDYIQAWNVLSDGTVVDTYTVLRSVGIAGGVFIYNDVPYLMALYGEGNQPTYFLIDLVGNIYMRLAYSNAVTYIKNHKTPSPRVVNDVIYFPYAVTDFLAPVNKTTNIPAGTPVNAIYTQAGINLAKFTINTSNQYTSEIASALHLTGGQLWEYDGVKPVEHGFQVWPDNVAGTTADGTGSGGNIGPDTYNYVFTYEWTDNAGNLHRSAPSIPLVITCSSTVSTNTLYVPTLRLTYKTQPNPVRIVGYRWSINQPVFYQFTSLTNPVINDPSIDFVTITDTLSDSQILGNVILYTTGGVVENIAAPASIASALFKNRLFLVDAEDRNLLWFSKQVIEAVPVEMSDLLTIYIAPTSGAQGSTGPITALSAMDDKLIIFKRDAIYYITGTGPDNTGANNDFSDPIFITASVGCTNPASIVLVPNGLMFQSDKGIWLLGRDLSTNYIGAPVERYNDVNITSAKAIPGTNFILFVLDSSVANIMLMYDYYYNQWGTFTSNNAISSTLYQNLHTYLNSSGLVFQETPGSYLDGSNPVLMSFLTSWVNVAGLQGFERLYFFYLLGTYFSPFKLNIGIAYNYNSGPTQTILVTPDNNTPDWGNDVNWGSNQNWGGGPGTGSSADSSGNVFAARLFPEQQKCESFQLSAQEIYDASFNVAAGQGLALSGMNLVIGSKRGFRTQRSSKSFG